MSEFAVANLSQRYDQVDLCAFGINARFNLVRSDFCFDFRRLGCVLPALGSLQVRKSFSGEVGTPLLGCDSEAVRSWIASLDSVDFDPEVLIQHMGVVPESAGHLVVGTLLGAAVGALAVYVLQKSTVKVEHRVSVELPPVPDCIKSFTEMFVTTFNRIVEQIDDLDPMSLGVLLLVFTEVIYRAQSVLDRWQVASALCGAVLVNKVVRSKKTLEEHISRVCMEFSRTRAESDRLTTLTKILLGVDFGDVKSLQLFNSRIRAVKSVTEMMSMANEFIKYFRDLFYEFSPHTPLLKEVEDVVEGISRANSSGEKRAVKALWNQLDKKINDYLETTKCDVKVYTALRRAQVKMRRSADESGLSKNDGSGLLQPLAFCLTGISGIGKTTVLKLLNAALATMCYGISGEEFDRNTSSYVYNLKPSADSYDGYGQQPFVIVDDYLQTRREHLTKENIGTLLISIINENRPVLEGDKITNKDNMLFTSDLVWLTSNTSAKAEGDTSKRMSVLHDQLVNWPDAIQRRIKYVINPVIAEDYKNDKEGLDLDKVRERNYLDNLNLDSFRQDVVKFDVYDGSKSSKDQPLGELLGNLDFTELYLLLGIELSALIDASNVRSDDIKRVSNDAKRFTPDYIRSLGSGAGGFDERVRRIRGRTEPEEVDQAFDAVKNEVEGMSMVKKFLKTPSQVFEAVRSMANDKFMSAGDAVKRVLGYDGACHCYPSPDDLPVEAPEPDVGREAEDSALVPDEVVRETSSGLGVSKATPEGRRGHIEVLKGPLYNLPRQRALPEDVLYTSNIANDEVVWDDWRAELRHCCRNFSRRYWYDLGVSCFTSFCISYTVISAIIFALETLASVFRYFFASSKESEAGSKEDPVDTRLSRRERKLIKKAAGLQAVPEGLNSTARKKLESDYGKYLYAVAANPGDVTRATATKQLKPGFGFAVIHNDTTYVLTNKHVVLDVRETGKVLKFIHCDTDNPSVYEVDEVMFCNMEVADLAWCRVKGNKPPALPFVENAQHLYKAVYPVVRGGTAEDSRLSVQTCKSLPANNLDGQETSSVVEYGDYSYCCIMMAHRTAGMGSCGLPVYMEKDGSLAVIGLHSAGNTFYSHASPIRFPESQVRQESAIGSPCKTFIGVTPYVRIADFGDDASSLEFWGRTKGPRRNTHESARRAFQEYMEHPSKCDLSAELIAYIMDSVFEDNLDPDCFKSTPLVEVIKGFDHTTSAGHLGAKWGPGKTGIWYEGSPGPKFDEYVAEVQAKLDEITSFSEAELRDRQGPEMVFEGACKQEMVADKYADDLDPDSEVIRRKTKESRYLSASSVVDTGLGGIAFTCLKESIIRHSANSEFTMGINACGEDWMMLYQKHAFLQKHFAGDFKKFDKSHIARLMWAICDSMLERIEQEWLRKLVIWFFAHIIMSKHCFLGEFTTWEKSMPSGNVLTTIINMIMLAFLYRYAYFVKFGQVEDFQSHVILSAYGDDSLVSVTPDCDFGPLDVAVALAEMNLDYTDHRGRVITSNEYFPLKSLTFLKRGFKEVRGYVMGNLSLQTIRTLFEWTKSLDSKIIDENYRMGCVELARHGQDIYANGSLDVKRVMLGRGLHFPTFSQSFRRAREGVMAGSVQKFMLLSVSGDFVKTPNARYRAVQTALPESGNNVETTLNGRTLPSSDLRVGKNALHQTEQVIRNRAGFRHAVSCRFMYCATKPRSCYDRHGNVHSRSAETREIVNTVHFEEGGQLAKNDQPVLLPLEPFPSNLNASFDSLEHFAKMPVRVSTGSLATTDLSGDKFLGIFTLDSFLTSATAFQARLRNVAAFKFDHLCIRIQTSCPANYNGVVGVSAWPRVSDNNLAFSDRSAKLCQSLVEYMVLPSDNAMEVKLPWVSPYEAYDRLGYQVSVNDPTRKMWQITPFVMSPLRYGTGGAVLDFEVYMWLEGFEVLTTTAESDPNGVPDVKLGEISLGHPSVAEDASKVVRGTIGIGRQLWPSALWELASGAASMMGLANPRVDSQTLTCVENLTSGGNRKAKMLGNLQDETAVSNLEKSSYDSLSFAAIGSVPHLALETTLPIGTSAGLLLNYKLSPFKSNKTAGLDINSVTAPSEIIASLFGQWRGDARITVVVGHSKQNTRFRITYVPFKESFSTLSEQDRSVLPSHVFATGETGEDGKATTTWSFDIPYCAPTQYCRSSFIPDANGSNENAMGHIVLETLNSVTGPDICGDMNVMVFISWFNLVCSGWGGSNTTYGPCLTGAQQASPESGDNGEVRLAGLLDSDSSDYPMCDGRSHVLHKKSKKVDFGRHPTMPHAHLEVDSCCGYPVSSFRQVIGKLMDVRDNSFPGVFNRTNGTYNFFKCEFYDIDLVRTGNLMGDLVAILRGMFCYETGSLVVATVPSSSTVFAEVKNFQPPEAGVVNNYSTYDPNMNGLRGFETFPTNGVCSVNKLPRYSRGKMTPLTPATNNGSVQFLSNVVCEAMPTTWTNIKTRNAAGELTETGLLRGGGEDYNLMWRRPVPTMFSSVQFT